MHAFAALLLVVASQDTAEVRAADAPLSRDFADYFKRADENKAAAIEASGDKSRKMNAAFARASRLEKLKIKIAVDDEKITLADLKRSDSHDTMPSKLRAGEIGLLKKVSASIKLDDEHLLIHSSGSPSWEAIVPTEAAKTIRFPRMGFTTDVRLDGVYQVKSLDGDLSAYEETKHRSSDKKYAVMERIDDAVVRQQRAAYVASKKKPASK